MAHRLARKDATALRAAAAALLSGDRGSEQKDTAAEPPSPFSTAGTVAQVRCAAWSQISSNLHLLFPLCISTAKALSQPHRCFAPSDMTFASTAPAPQVDVVVMRALRLPALTDADPFVRIELGKQKHDTGVRRRMVDPDFNGQHFAFKLVRQRTRVDSQRLCLYFAPPSTHSAARFFIMYFAGGLAAAASAARHAWH